jgi:hypothetical protein
MFCHSTTEEFHTVANPVQDLSEKRVIIPCHQACYRRKIVALWLRFAAMSLVIMLVLSGLELLLLQTGRKIQFSVLSSGWLILNAVVGVISGAISGLRASNRFLKKFQNYIQIRTYPYD